METTKTAKCPTPRKHRYYSAERAEEQRLKHDDPEILKVYNCQCGSFHLTSQTLLSILEHPNQTWKMAKLRDGNIALSGIRGTRGGKVNVVMPAPTVQEFAQWLLDNT